MQTGFLLLTFLGLISAVVNREDCRTCQTSAMCCERQKDGGNLPADPDDRRNYWCDDMIYDYAKDPVKVEDPFQLECDPESLCVKTCEWRLPGPGGDVCRWQAGQFGEDIWTCSDETIKYVGGGTTCKIQVFKYKKEKESSANLITKIIFIPFI